MNISEFDASRLARFLAKGIFRDPANKDVSISIGEKTKIGIERRGHKYLLYINYNEITNKADTFTGFNDNIPLEDLSFNIKRLIEHSATVKDVVLNMEKVPMLPEEAIATSEKTGFEQVSAAPINANAENSANEETALPDNLSGTESADLAGAAVTEDTTPLSAPAVTNGTNRYGKTAEPLEVEPAEHEDAAFEGELAQDDEDAMYKRYQQLVGQPVIPDDSEPQQSLEEDEMEEHDMDTTALANETKTTKIETSVSVKGMMPTKVDNKQLPKTSYLANVIGTEDEIKQKLYKAVDQLVTRDKESAIESYIRMLYRLLPLFNNDISSAATGTGLDQRDFMLSVYERSLFTN